MSQMDVMRPAPSTPKPMRFWVIDGVILSGLVTAAFRSTTAVSRLFELQPDSLPVLYFFAAVLTFVVWKAYVWLQAPYFLKTPSTQPRPNRGQRPRDFPPPYPNGWFHVCPSEEIAAGEVRELQMFGQYQVLFRNRKGVASVLDAYCPHLGANLGVGGSVSEHDCLKCPFHGWEFDTTGKCRKVHGTDTIPANSDLRSWPTREIHGGIFVWHHSDGTEPDWTMPVRERIASGSYYCCGKTRAIVHAHCQELPENGPDSAHLNVLHKSFVFDPLNPFGMRHLWTANWQPHPDHKHMSQINLTQGMTLFGVTIPGTSVVANINQVGPGIVALSLLTPVGEVIAFEYVTPLKPTSLLVQHTMYCQRTFPRFLGKAVLWALEKQFSRDVPIWEAKKFEGKPVLSKADGPILAFRRWFTQFYASSSLSFSDAVAKEHMMEW